MNTRLSNARARGSAILVALVLVMAMGALIVANATLLDHLGRELKQLDREQVRRQTDGTAQTPTPPPAPRSPSAQ